MKINHLLKVIAVAILFIHGAKAQTPFVHPEGKFMTINGAKLWVETAGKGDPLFLIAGGPGNSHNYTHAWFCR